MIFDNFKISGTRVAALDVNDLLRKKIMNDNVQCFDAEWDEVLFSMAKIPYEDM